MKHSTKRKITGGFIFNMDETGFVHKKKTRKVISVTGSKNVWSKSVEASFHMMIVACVSDNGFSVPPLFVLPDQRLNRATMEHCSVTGSTATVAPKGFVNSNIFIKWLDHFSSNVSSHLMKMSEFTNPLGATVEVLPVTEQCSIVARFNR